MPKRNLGKSIEQIRSELVRFVKRVPTIVGVEATNHFKRNFRLGGFQDDGISKWQARKNDKDPGRAILVKTGRLVRSIRVLEKSDTHVIVGVDLDEVPYAQIHNQGGVIVMGGRPQVLHFNKRGRFAKAKRAKYAQKIRRNPHPVFIPKRQFVGNSKLLNTVIQKKLLNELNTIFK